MAHLFISIYLLNGSLCSLIHLTTSTIVEKILLTMLANRAFSALFSSVNFLCFSSRDSVSSLLVLRLEVMVVVSRAVYYDRSWSQQLKHSEEKSTTLSQDFKSKSKVLLTLSFEQQVFLSQPTSQGLITRKPTNGVFSSVANSHNSHHPASQRLLPHDTVNNKQINTRSHATCFREYSKIPCYIIYLFTKNHVYEYTVLTNRVKHN